LIPSGHESVMPTKIEDPTGRHELASFTRIAQEMNEYYKYNGQYSSSDTARLAFTALYDEAFKAGRDSVLNVLNEMD